MDFGAVGKIFEKVTPQISFFWVVIFLMYVITAAVYLFKPKLLRGSAYFRRSAASD